MGFSLRVKNFLKTGKVSLYDQLVELFLTPDCDERGLAVGLEKLSFDQKEELLATCWTRLNDERRKILVTNLYQEGWIDLISQFTELRESEQIHKIEILGYLSSKEVAAFLLEQLKSKKDGVRLTACGALKRQDPRIILEPILEALTKPDQWQPARVFEILQGMGTGWESHLLQLVTKVDESIQEIIVEILGEVENQDCLPVLEKLLPRAGATLRLRIGEALVKLRIPGSWPLLLKLLEDESWQIRMIAAQALGQLKVTQVIPILETRKNIEEDSLVQECILEALTLLEEVPVQVIGNWVRKG